MKILGAMALILILASGGCGYRHTYRERAEIRRAREDFRRAAWEARTEMRRAGRDLRRELQDAREDLRRELRQAHRDFHHEFSRW